MLKTLRAAGWTIPIKQFSVQRWQIHFLFVSHFLQETLSQRRFTAKTVKGITPQSVTESLWCQCRPQRHRLWSVSASHKTEQAIYQDASTSRNSSGEQPTSWPSACAVCACLVLLQGNDCAVPLEDCGESSCSGLCA